MSLITLWNGRRIPRIGVGCWAIGGTFRMHGQAAGWGEVDDAVSTRALHLAFDLGARLFDTADAYGTGHSEGVLGRAFADRRSEVVIATKFGFTHDLAERELNGSNTTPVYMEQALAASLERLGTDRIDLYQLHWPDATGVPLEDTWGAMGELVEAGAVQFVGVSNFDRGQIETCLTIRHVDSLQPEFSILAQDERDVIRWCGEVGVGVVSYSPLGAGLLTGAVTADTEIDDWRSDVTEGFLADRAASLAVVDRLRPVADGLGVSLAELALAWNVAQPGVTAAIAGSRNARHVRANARAGDIELDEAALRAVDDALTQ